MQVEKKKTKPKPTRTTKVPSKVQEKKQQITLGAGHACLQQDTTGTFNKDNQLNIKSTESNTVTIVVLYKVKNFWVNYRPRKVNMRKQHVTCFRKLFLYWYLWESHGETSPRGISEECRGPWPADLPATLSYPKHCMSIHKPEDRPKRFSPKM